MKRLSFYLLILTFILSFMQLNLFAQKPIDDRSLQILPEEDFETVSTLHMRKELKTGKPVALYNLNISVTSNSPLNMAREFLSSYSEVLKLSPDLNDVRYVVTKETPETYHVHFKQFINDYPVHNSDINVTISKNNNVIFLSNGYKVQFGQKEEIYAGPVNVSDQQAISIAKNYLGVTGQISHQESEVVYYYKKGKFYLTQKINIVPSENVFGDWELFVDARSGEILRVEDKACYTHGNNPNKPTLIDGSGWVFDPDPISHATTTYGSPGFSDNNDADSDSLTAHLETRVLEDIFFDGTNYKLENQWAEIRDFESPFTGLHTNTTSDFHFTRQDDNFEAVNVFFHIAQSMKYINQTLGIALMPYQYSTGVRFDPHGLGGADNSHYITSTGSVAFGDGGVDDAEDFGVVIHELGHGLHDWVTNGGLSQNQGLSEGCGDYWASSYLRSTGYWQPGDPAYDWVFVWDGHNPFWAGRITNYTAHYPEGLVGQIHTDGQMWASSLMSIYDLIGREATDKNFLTGLAMTNGSSNQQDVANAFIQADQVNYGGANLNHIVAVFSDRGYIDGPVTADFSADVTGGQAPLTVNFSDMSVGNPDPIISWEWDFDNDGTIDSNLENPTHVYTSAGTYTVSLTVSDGTNSATETKTDYISVNAGVLVWEGEANGPNYSGTFIKDYLTTLGYTVVYNSSPTLPSSLLGYDAVFLSFGNYGSGSGTHTTFEDDDAATVLAYLQNGGKVYLEGGDALGFDQSSNTALHNAFGLADVSDGSSSNTPVTDLQGQTGALTEGMSFSGSTQPQNSWIDIFTTDANGVLAFAEATIGNVAVQSAQGNSRTFCFSYALGKLTDGTTLSTRNELIDQLLLFFDIPVPVELTSFTAASDDGKVILNWTTATEINNQGFSIERKYENQDFSEIAFVAGFGTTFEKHNYSFIDESVKPGKVYYRLKQMDFDGTYSYSDIVEVDFNSPSTFSLSQNYPNPFNPSTKIKYSLPQASSGSGLSVLLTVYDVLGNEVAILVNEEQTAGFYEVEFSGEDLSSGMYFYKLEVGSGEGVNFSQTNKMLLLK